MEHVLSRKNIKVFFDPMAWGFRRFIKNSQIGDDLVIMSASQEFYNDAITSFTKDVITRADYKEMIYIQDITDFPLAIVLELSASYSVYHVKPKEDVIKEYLDMADREKKNETSFFCRFDEHSLKPACQNTECKSFRLCRPGYCQFVPIFEHTIRYPDEQNVFTLIEKEIQPELEEGEP